MAFSPPWLPLPSTSLNTTGSTAASSWPSAPLNAGEFSKESRIPMVSPFGLNARHRFQIQSAFGYPGQAANTRPLSHRFQEANRHPGVEDSDPAAGLPHQPSI